MHNKEGDRYYHMGRGLGTIVAGASKGNVAINYDNGYNGEVTTYEFYMMLKYGILLKEPQMKSRPLKVGEYRKVKTWEQLLATEGAKVNEDGTISVYGAISFLRSFKEFCGDIVLIDEVDGVGDTVYCSFWFNDWFFTNDYYDSNGNEIKMSKINNTGITETLLYQWLDDISQPNPLDTLEHEANLTLTKIAKLREIEAKQAEIDKLGLEIEEMIEEYLR